MNKAENFRAQSLEKGLKTMSESKKDDKNRTIGGKNLKFQKLRKVRYRIEHERLKKLLKELVYLI